MPNYLPLSDAPATLSRANRVLVVGCSGGGKTTQSRQIAARLALPYISIDRDVRWLPGWKEREHAEQRTILARLVRQERWLIDGSGASTFDIRLPRAELVLWVRVPRRVALAGVVRRVTRHRGRVRPDMASGCPERLPDRAFLSYIWNFEKVHAPRFVLGFDAFGADVPIVVMRRRNDMTNLIENIVPPT